MATTDNKLDIVQGVPLLPWEWANLGAVFGSAADNSQCVAARANFVLRKGGGLDGALERAGGRSSGSVLEGLGDVGFNLRAQQYAFHISASNLAYKQGTDAPLRAQSVVGNALASLKLAYAQEVADDRFVAVSYDLKQKKPELSMAWAGDTFAEKASLAVTLDPVDRALRLRAAVVMPGPEWRTDVYNEDTRQLELVPIERSSRHTFWVEHEMRRGELMAATKAGARLDLGRLANLAAAFVDSHVEPHIPLIWWKIPLTRRLYEWAVPASNLDQMRYNISGWGLEAAHDFDRNAAAGRGKGPVLGVSKRLSRGSKGSGVTLAATCDTGDSTLGLELRSAWLCAAARVSRASSSEGGGGVSGLLHGWSSPSVQLMVQPLGFL